MNQLNTAFFNLLVRADLEPQSYSGRGMDGRRCLSIYLHDGNNHLRVVADILDMRPEDVMDLGELARIFRNSREDGMGLGTVLYFPSVEWEDAWNDRDAAT